MAHLMMEHCLSTCLVAAEKKKKILGQATLKQEEFTRLTMAERVWLQER